MHLTELVGLLQQMLLCAISLVNDYYPFEQVDERQITDYIENTNRFDEEEHTMSVAEETERNKAFIRAHFEEFVNRKNAAVIFQNMTEDFYDHDGPGGKPTNAAGDKAMMEALYLKYPDLHVSIDDIVAEGDKVVCRNRWLATDVATGKRIEFHGFVMWRMVNGKIAERWATVTQPQEEVGLSS